MLKIEDLNVYYDKIHAIKGVSFEVRDGEICTLIGANGAGKTTILQTISGLLHPKSGRITFDGYEITGRQPNKILLRGLAQVPEGRRVFSKMTVQENLEMGAYTRKDAAGIREDYEMVFQSFPRLKERIHQQAGTLSGGEQQMLAMGRALMSRPRMLLLDEPSMGLAPILVDEIFSIIRQVNKSGVTVLLVEQNATKALEIADYSYVLSTGKIVGSGEGRSLLSDSSVRSAYLG
ncbi:MAG: ABC transporter ATP-binding protein [Clostridiales bacterium]|nr:ABC transporter ATP-binding protein [Clostridiales bacterium]